ncbi:MYG1 family protein [Pseudooceanicola sp. HF7]|uniref:MYG1 family protein n=1 Tax=Pseudooceanicola sp. HF7 TaxID=2721560 RepID=UPI001430DE97|nr:MYG1 family protein [Pseudooceanicola sp. HF7]NIZ08739.1 MYG1 family protein [Pseudooceanicola sp. HF7]
MTITTLVTHSGGFHADEVLSTVILTRLYPEAEVVRSRAPEWITPAEGRVIYDVGGTYDAEAGIFDHHQRESPLREDETPYSSFGLIWKHFGLDYLRSFDIPEDDLEKIHHSFDRSFVLPVDQVDNGTVSVSEAGPLSSLTLPGLIETLKPVFDDKDQESETRAFHAAVGIARQFVEARVARSAAKRRAELLAAEAVIAAGDSPILELPMGMPFRPAVVEAGADHLLFVVTPRDGGDWTLGGIRKYDEGFAQRADLPAAWGGLSGAELEEVTGVNGATFCHKALFIAAAKGRDAIMQMANLAVEEARRLEAERPVEEPAPTDA